MYACMRDVRHFSLAGDDGLAEVADGTWRLWLSEAYKRGRIKTHNDDYNNDDNDNTTTNNINSDNSSKT